MNHHVSIKNIESVAEPVETFMNDIGSFYQVGIPDKGAIQPYSSTHLVGHSVIQWGLIRITGLITLITPGIRAGRI
jgi:hypothetical protein